MISIFYLRSLTDWVVQRLDDPSLRPRIFRWDHVRLFVIYEAREAAAKVQRAVFPPLTREPLNERLTARYRAQGN